MSTRRSQNDPRRQAKKAAQSRKQADKKRSLMATNALLATGTCCLIIASMLIMYSRTRFMTYGMPGGLLLCSIGAAAIGLSYFDVAKKFAIICFSAAVLTFACAVVTFLGALGLVN